MKFRISLVFLLIILFTACGNQTKVIDVEKTASDIVTAINFEDKLELINDDIAVAIYGFDKENISYIASYIGSGATAEEVTVVEFKTMTDNEKQLFEKRIENQIKSYETYIPEEIERLKENVILFSGNTAVLCVSADSDNASAVIENLIL